MPQQQGDRLARSFYFCARVTPHGVWPSAAEKRHRKGCAMGRSINLEGKVALVTGASSGLGQRFAQVLSQAGAKVVLASRRVERLKELRA
ncbi:SDR family NAD(P)-dependent oxidoreductase, partial [Burkholderia ubonensis]|uniref:SDR family NAD(P)-dependent oxidoreductase n=1 Tax=Burkholderia ubonensis TaxID=101571 RepID=UPI00210D28B6